MSHGASGFTIGLEPGAQSTVERRNSFPALRSGPVRSASENCTGVSCGRIGMIATVYTVRNNDALNHSDVFVANFCNEPARTI